MINTSKYVHTYNSYINLPDNSCIELPDIILTFILAPSKPHSLKLVYINSSSVILQWAIPEIPNGNITQYSIQFNQADGATVTTYYDGNMLIGTIKGLSPDTMYILQLRAYTRVGAGPSNNLTVITCKLLNIVISCWST